MTVQFGMSLHHQVYQFLLTFPNVQSSDHLLQAIVSCEPFQPFISDKHLIMKHFLIYTVSCKTCRNYLIERFNTVNKVSIKINPSSSANLLTLHLLIKLLTAKKIMGWIPSFYVCLICILV